MPRSSDKKARRDPDAEWSDGDQGMLLTCRIIADFLDGRVPAIRVPTYFKLPQGTVALVNGPLRVLELGAIGDGSYQRTGTILFGGGAIGLAMLAGSLAGNAIGNSRARDRALADAQVTFRHSFDADVYVTNTGFTLLAPNGVFTWDWSSIEAMQLVGPHDVLMQGQSDRGPLTWRLLTPWAELIMVCWAMDQHPEHPQLRDGSWLAPGWLDRARGFGHDPGLTSPAIDPPNSPPQLPGYR